MKEKYDALLLHGYTDQMGYIGQFGERNLMQSIATEKLYKAGYINKVIIAGGHYWGNDKPTFAEIMSRKLSHDGINHEDIITRPEATTTGAEIEVFLNEAKIENWSNLISLANRSHSPRIHINYIRKRRLDVDHINTERVLYNINDVDAILGKDFLPEFRKKEKIFITREALAITLDLLGLSKLMQKFSDSDLGKKIKAKIDK